MSKAPEKEKKAAKAKTIPSPDADQPEASGSKRDDARAKRQKEFMDAMKGTDGSAQPAAGPSGLVKANGGDGSIAVPGDAGWKAEGLPGRSSGPKADKAQKSRKGKEKSEEPPVAADEADEDDDDAAWLARRKNVTLESTELPVEGDAAAAAASGPADDLPPLRATTVYTDPTTELILSTGRLFIRNLPFVTTSSDLSAHFSKFGHVEETHMPVAHQTGDPLGTAYVMFRDPASALAAYKALDKTTFQGRLLHVLPGRAKPGQENTVSAPAGASGTGGKKADGEKEVLGKTKEGRLDVKAKGDAKKKDASSKGVNWAALYMNVSPLFPA